MERDFADDYIFQMVKLPFPLKIDVETVFDTDFHFHGSNCGFFDGVIG